MDTCSWLPSQTRKKYANLLQWATGQKIVPKNQDCTIEEVDTLNTAAKEPSPPLCTLIDSAELPVTTSVTAVAKEPVATLTKLPVTTPTLRIIAGPVKVPNDSTVRVVDGPIKRKKAVPQSAGKEMMVVTRASPRIYGKPIIFSQLVEKHNPNEKNRWSSILTSLTSEPETLSNNTIRITEREVFECIEPDVEEENDNEWETVSRTKARPHKSTKSAKTTVKYGK